MAVPLRSLPDSPAGERLRQAVAARAAVTAAVTVIPAESHDCSSHRCWYASTPAVECSHGPCPEHGSRRSTLAPAPRRDPFAGIPVADDDTESWGITVAPVRRGIFDFEGAM